MKRRFEKQLSNGTIYDFMQDEKTKNHPEVEELSCSMEEGERSHFEWQQQ